MLLCIKSYILLNLSFIKDNKEFNKLLRKLKYVEVSNGVFIIWYNFHIFFFTLHFFNVAMVN